MRANSGAGSALMDVGEYGHALDPGKTIAARLLGAVESLVDAFDKRVGIVFMPWAAGADTYADGDKGPVLARMCEAQPPDTAQKSPGVVDCAFGRGHGHQHRKFLAADSADTVELPGHGLFQGTADSPEAFIALRVAKAVVVGLEMIDIEVDE